MNKRLSFILLGLCLYCLVSCVDHTDATGTDGTIKADSLALQCSYEENLYDIFLLNIEEESLTVDGIRLSLCQSMGAPTYVYTITFDKIDSVKIHRKIINSSTNKIITEKRIKSKKTDFVIKKVSSILEEGAFWKATRCPTPTEGKIRISSADTWSLEVSKDNTKKVIEREYQNKYYYSLVEKLKKLFNISENTYTENLLFRRQSVIAREDSIRDK